MAITYRRILRIQRPRYQNEILKPDQRFSLNC